MPKGRLQEPAGKICRIHYGAHGHIIGKRYPKRRLVTAFSSPSGKARANLALIYLDREPRRPAPTDPLACSPSSPFYVFPRGYLFRDDCPRSNPHPTRPRPSGLPRILRRRQAGCALFSHRFRLRSNRLCRAAGTIDQATSSLPELRILVDRDDLGTCCRNSASRWSIARPCSSNHPAQRQPFIWKRKLSSTLRLEGKRARETGGHSHRAS